MMGLLDLLPNLPEDPQKREAVRMGLLNFGAQMMSAKGGFMPALGQGLLGGTQAYTQQMETGQQAELRKMQMEQAKRQQQQAQGQQEWISSMPKPTISQRIDPANSPDADPIGMVSQQTQQPGNDAMMNWAMQGAQYNPAVLSSLLGNIMPKQQAPYNLGTNEVRYDGNNNIVARGPTTDANPIGKIDPDKFTPSSLAKYSQSGKFEDLVPQETPRAPVIREMISGDTTIQQQWDPATKQWQEVGRGPRFARQVAPVVHIGTGRAPSGYRFTANGDLEPIAGGPADRPSKPLPAAAAGKLLENTQNLRRAEQALAMIQGKTVNGAKGDPNATGAKGYLPDFMLQRMDESGVATRAAIADLGSLVIHDRSGAAVTAAEYPRLAPFIPKATDDPATVQKKLARFVQEYRDVVGEASDFYSQSGYNVPTDALRTNRGGASGDWESAPKPSGTGSGQAMSQLPKANASNKGKLIIDRATGKRLRSNGLQWKEEK